MQITEASVYEALGMTPPESGSQGAQVQEVADPAPQSAQEDPNAAGATVGGGAQAQEVADPAGDDTGSDTGADDQAAAAIADPEDPENSGDSGTDGNKPPLTAEQRRANAARRREQEEKVRTQAAVDAALQAEREKVASGMQPVFDILAQKYGVEATDYQAITKAIREDVTLVEDKAMEQGVDVQDYIKMRNMELENASMRRQVEQAQQAAQAEADKTRMNAQIEQISKIDPLVKDRSDLLKIPEAKQLYDYVKRGYALEDAHALATRQRLEGSRIDAARQQALNNNRGKDHLQSAGNSRGNGAISVPPEVKKMYKLMNPGASEAEIQAHFNNYMKQGG